MMSTSFYLHFLTNSFGDEPGFETFEEQGFDNFELYNTGSLTGQALAADPWSNYANNPITQNNHTWGSVLKDGTEYKMYYSVASGIDRLKYIGLATSSDGKNWTDQGSVISKGVTGEWDANGIWVPMVWKEDNTYHMIYTGISAAGVLQIGHATSSNGTNWTKDSNNPVFNCPEGTWCHNYTENFGVMKVDSTYYMWVNNLGGGIRKSGVATSTDLVNWSLYQDDPIFTGGRFCGSPFKYDNYYYFLVPHYTSGEDYAQIELYRSPNPYFLPLNREFVRIAIQFGSNGEWNDRDQDTPFVLTDDIYRNSFSATNNELWVYYAGINAEGIWRTGLAIETDIAAALEPVNELPLWIWGDYVGTARTVVDTPTRQGNRAINQSDTSSSSYSLLYTDFSSKTTGAIGAWMRKSNTDEWFDIDLYSGATAPARAGFGTTYFHYFTGVYVKNTAITYSADTWYLVILEFNTDTDKYNFVVYDANLNEIVRQNNISFLSSSEAIDKVRFLTNNAFIGDTYIDDFRLRQYSSPEPSIRVGSEVLAFDTNNPTIQPTVANSLTFTSLSTFTETATKNGGEIKYQISNDSGNTLYWWNGSNWETSTSEYSEANTASEININISSFPTGDGNFLFKAFLHSDGTQLVQLDSLAVAGVPLAPIIGSPTALSSSSIHWNFTDTADDNTGFRLYDNTHTLVTSSATANLTYLDETGLSENTQYTGRYLTAYNDYGNSASSSVASSVYTLADTPTNLTASSVSTNSITLSVDSFPNDTSGSSRYFFENTTKETNSGWIQTNSWQDTGLSCSTSYTYTVKYRNGDRIETDSISLTQLTNSCGGGLPSGAYSPPRPPTPSLDNPQGGFVFLINDGAKETTQRKVILTINGGPDAVKMSISEDPDFSDAIQEPYTSTKTYLLSEGDGLKTVYVKFYTQWGQSSTVISDSIILKTEVSLPEKPIIEKPISEMTVAEIRAKITEIMTAISQLERLLSELETPTIKECTVDKFDRNLTQGMSGNDVKCLQIILNSEPNTKVADSGAGSPSNETDYFGPLTRAAVIKFQEKYASDILAPWELTRGTGFVGTTTRAKLNEMLDQ